MMNKALITALLAAGLAGTAFAASHTGAAMGAASAPSASASASASTGSSSTTAPTKADVKAAKKQADGDYKAAKAKCKPMKGDEKKACELDAKSAHDKALADVKREQAEAKAAAKKS